MKMADADMVHRLLDYPYLIEALHAAHQDAHCDADHIVSREPGGGPNQFVTLVGWKPGAGIAVKMVGVFPDNLTRDPPRPSVQGLVALFDPVTGGPLLVADGAAMTFRKTAADSGLGARMLARGDSRTLLVVGAGGLAPHVVAAHRAARPSLARVLIWNRTPARATALAARLAGRPDMQGIDIAATDDLDAAVAKADIVSCVTMARAPLIKGALLKPGAHLDLIGAYLPDMREADDDAIARGTVFVDCRDAMNGSGELADPVAAGIIGWDDVQADLYQLCQGRHHGRRSDTDITVFKNVGGAHLDLMATVALARRLT